MNYSYYSISRTVSVTLGDSARGNVKQFTLDFGHGQIYLLECYNMHPPVEVCGEGCENVPSFLDVVRLHY